MNLNIISVLNKLFNTEEKVKIFTNLEQGIIKDNAFVLHHHLGLGDVICLFGLVKEIQQKFPAHTIHLPVKTHYLESVNVLYKYLKPNFKIFPIDTSLTEDENQQVTQYAKTKRLKILRIGFEKLMHPHHYSMFFQQVNLGYRLSWDNFPDIPEDESSTKLYQTLTGANRYNLIIDANSQGPYRLKLFGNSLPNIRLHNAKGSRGIFDWITIIKNATEIHTVGTAAFHLVDRVNFRMTPELYFHNVNNDFNTVDTKLRWNLVDYHKVSF